MTTVGGKYGEYFVILEKRIFEIESKQKLVKTFDKIIEVKYRPDKREAYVLIYITLPICYAWKKVRVIGQILLIDEESTRSIE